MSTQGVRLHIQDRYVSLFVHYFPLVLVLVTCNVVLRFTIFCSLAPITKPLKEYTL